MNEAGYESGNDNITEGRTLPWLQDTEDTNVWDLWEVAYRDVFIMDTTGIIRFRYNLTVHDISNPDNYASLYDGIIEVTEMEESVE